MSKMSVMSTQSMSKSAVLLGSRSSHRSTDSMKGKRSKSRILMHGLPVNTYEPKMQQFQTRNLADDEFINNEFIEDPNFVNNVPDRATLIDEDPLLREPSFSKFKIPFEMVCIKRYKDSVEAYNNQFIREIKQLINYQPSALEAAYLVRIMSYTSLWPPYHNEAELSRTSKSFFKLTAKESARLKYLQSHDII